MQRVQPGHWRPRNRTAARDERIQDIWITQHGLRQPRPVHAWHGAAELIRDVRTPHRNNWDFVAGKDLRLGGSMRGQIRLEVLNITNTVKVRGPITHVGSATFGQIRVQSGFMRLTQLMFRLTF